MQTSVYAAYDDEGVLLYVGASKNVKQRLTYHKCASPWGRKMKSHLVKHFPTKKQATTFETRCIQVLKPLYNVAVFQGQPHLHCSEKAAWLQKQKLNHAEARKWGLL